MGRIHQQSLEELRAVERTMIVVRWLTVPFALVQVLTFYMPYPPGVEERMLLATGLFALANVGITAAWWRARSLRTMRRMGAVSLAVDFAFAMTLVVGYTFDPNTAIFVMVYLLPLEAATRYGLRGALLTMLAAGVAYTLREWWGSVHYGIDILWASISFRMGVGMLIAAVTGAMASGFRREHARVAELYENERAAAEALRAMDELKNTFLSAVSHELRTPLTSIMGFAITLQDRAGEIAPANRRMVDYLVEEARTLDALLDDLLDLDRLTRGSVELQRAPVDIAALVRRVVARLEQREQRVVAIDAPALELALDERKVERIVENLVTNAIKYTPRGTAIEVRVSEVPEGVLLVVDDRGPGVRAELRETVFQPFRRGDEELRHSPGTGIGLSLVRSFAELHGGAAWVQERSAGERGASFRVLLRAHDGHQPPAAVG